MPKTQLPVYKIKYPLPDGEIPFIIASFDQLGPLAQLDHPHSHTLFHILYLTAGSGTHFIDFNAYDLTPPVVFFLRPGQVHYYKLDTPLDGYGILFAEDFLLPNADGYPHSYQLDFLIDSDNLPFLQIDADEAIALDKLIADICTEYDARDLHRYSTLQAYLHILLVRLQRISTSKVGKYEMSIPHSQILQFKKLVSEHFLTERDIQFYADQIGLSANYLATMIKDLTGLTPGQIIRRAVALEAKRLLVYQEQSIEQVSHQLQFKDPSYFARFFKREVGVTPSAFREYTLEKHQNL